ncbi:MAG: PAS domain-containing protein, partial [Gammaproteobacteria bacterium]|nr:PAS domain-containing protein [Gammaproteobacteria bacterium]
MVRITAGSAEQTEAFYQVILDSLPNQVAVVDANGRTRYSNAAWREHFEGVVAPAAERLMREGRYLEACEAALTQDIGASADSLSLMRTYLAALRNIIAGVRDEFALEYEVPGQGRWFRVRLARSRSGNGDIVIQRENITVEKHAERGAENTRRFLQSLIDLLPTRILWKDTEGRILGANRAFLDDAGMANVVGRTDADMPWGPGEAARIRRDDERVMDGGLPEFNREQEIPWRDSTRWFREDRMPLLRPDGTTSGILVAYADITNLKRTEDALARHMVELKASEQRLRATVESAELGLYESDLPTGAVLLGSGWCRLLGLPPVDTRTTIADYQQRVHPDDLMRVGTGTWEAAMSSADQFHLEYRVRHANGRWIWIHDGGRVVERLPNGEPRRIVGVITDITRRKDAEQEAQRRAERLDLAASAAGLGVWDQDLRTGQSYWDLRMRELYGVDPALPDDAIDKDLMARLCHPDDLVRVRTAIHAALASSREFEAEYRVIRPDGSHRHVDCRAMIYRDAAGAPVRIVGVSMDVTERNRLLQERQQAQRLEAIGQLAAGIAHEINTPTQYIGDNTRFVKEAFDGVLGLLDLARR